MFELINKSFYENISWSVAYFNVNFEYSAFNDVVNDMRKISKKKFKKKKDSSFIYIQFITHNWQMTYFQILINKIYKNLHKLLYSNYLINYYPSEYLELISLYIKQTDIYKNKLYQWKFTIFAI